MPLRSNTAWSAAQSGIAVENHRQPPVCIGLGSEARRVRREEWAVRFMALFALLLFLAGVWLSLREIVS